MMKFCFTLILFASLCDQNFATQWFYEKHDFNGSQVCSLDSPSESLTSESITRCALLCFQSPFCFSFNYDAIRSRCDIFPKKPTCYGPSTTCIHYQIEADIPYTDNPAENCSLPFTYNTKLYMGCEMNITGIPCSYGCLDSNRNIISCERDFTVVYTTRYVSIPPDSTALLSTVNHWIVIQQRLDDSVDFARPWRDYKAGFGNIDNNFWLGLERMHQLVTQALYRLRVEIQTSDQDKWFSAEYKSFLIGSEARGYAIYVSGFVGDAGDALQATKYNGDRNHNGMKFSTLDVDNDLSTANCAVIQGGGGWWYNRCSCCNLNNRLNSTNFYWCTLVDGGLDSTGYLQKSRMMIKVS